MRALVTGGAGFIGSHLIDELVNSGYEVRIFDNLSSGSLRLINHQLNDEKVEFIQGDLTSIEEVERATEGIDCVFHLAANPDIRLGTKITDTDLKQGTIATYNILESMRINGIDKIIFASSSVCLLYTSPSPRD